jgi:hypothetical protein
MSPGWLSVHGRHPHASCQSRTVDDCGWPPRDQSRKFAVIAISPTVGACV